MYKTWAMHTDELWSDQFWGLAGSLVRATEKKGCVIYCTLISSIHTGYEACISIHTI